MARSLCEPYTVYRAIIESQLTSVDTASRSSECTASKSRLPANKSNYCIKMLSKCLRYIFNNSRYGGSEMTSLLGNNEYYERIMRFPNLIVTLNQNL